jgi:tryprostatin B 6-hydroxylase
MTYPGVSSLSIVIYRLFLHPLRAYPGPVSGKLTRFVASWHVVARDSHQWIMDQHKKVQNERIPIVHGITNGSSTQYGDVVRISPNELSYISVSSVEWIHGSKAAKLARGPFYAGDPNRPADSMLSTQDLEEHRWRRRGWEPGFGTVQLKEYEPRVLKHLDVLVSQLRARKNSKIFNVSTASCAFLTLCSDSYLSSSSNDQHDTLVRVLRIRCDERPCL